MDAINNKNSIKYDELYDLNEEEIMQNDNNDIDLCSLLDEITKENDISNDVLNKYFYDRTENYKTEKTTDYTNQNFCYYCSNYMVLPNQEMDNFLNNHFKINKYSKYLFLVFRLCPYIFYSVDVMSNKYLEKFILTDLNLQSDYDKNKKFDIFNDYNIKNGFQLKPFVFENLFHQPKLNFCDYIKCDICKNYLCPMHVSLSNCFHKKCNICSDKIWNVCGWCKFDFEEHIACKYIHQKNNE